MNKRRELKLMKHNKRFQCDLWGIVSISDKNTKVLNFLFDIYRNDKAFFSLLRKQRFFFNRQKFSFLYKVRSSHKQIMRRKRSLKVHNYLEFLKLRKFYGSFRKKQFNNSLRKIEDFNKFFSIAYVFLLESRLDIVLFRLNLFKSIFSVRQFLNHNNLYINGTLINKTSYRLNLGDIIFIKPSSNFLLYQDLLNRLSQNKILVNYPAYLEVNYKLGVFIFLALPKSTQIPYPFDLDLKKMLHNTW